MLSVEEINRLESENNMLRDSLSLANNIVNKYHAIIQEIKSLVENNGNYFTEDILDIIDRMDGGIMGIFSKDEEPSWSDVIHLEKQVKELKAENERLKECNEELTSDNLNTIQEMDNERRRVEQLKQDIEAYKQSEQENEKLKALCDTYKTCYQAKHSDIKCLFIKYKQTLQDIKELAKGLINGSIGGCEDDIGYKLQKIITKAEEE